MKKIIGIPAYNEEKMIANVVKESLNFGDEVIVVDDGSDDNTKTEAKNAGAYVIRHEKNAGKGAAMKSLFNYAKEKDTDILVIIDGDGQFLPKEIPNIILPIIENKADVVIGYRFDTETDMPQYRKIGNKFFDKVTNLASELNLRDTQSGFRAYSKKAINSITFHSNNYGAESEILISAAKNNLRFAEEKVSVIYQTGGNTSKKHPVSHSSDVLTSLLELIAIKHPLKMLGIPGIILLIIGIVFSVIVISLFNDTRYFSIPSTLLALGTLMTGLIFLLMSVVLFAIQRSFRRI